MGKKDDNGNWPKNGVNYFEPHKMPLTMIQAIGGRFLLDKSGWFYTRIFEFFDLEPKYWPLLGDERGPKGA